MTNDNIITRDDAIDRMKAGLPCETFDGAEGWKPTFWADLDFSHVTFRKPPEAREWLICDDTVMRFDPGVSSCSNCIHVREVLPGDVVVRKRTRDEWRELFGALYLPQLEELGLIGEGP